MRPSRVRQFFLAVIISSIALLAGAQSTPFTVNHAPLDALALAPGATQQLTVSLRIPAGHYVYQDATTLEFTNADGFTIGAIDWPTAHPHADPFSGATKMIWDSSVILHIPITAPRDGAAARTIRATFSYQGCSPELCYRQMTLPIEWTATIAGLTAAAPDAPQTHTWADLVLRPAEHLFLHGTLWTFVLAWLGGFLTGFTPCVLPMLPVVLMVIGVTPHRRRRNFVLASCLAAGLALTYALLGAAGAVLGLPIGFLFGQRWFLILVVLFFLAMAASMFGLFHLQLPSRWQTRLNRLGGHGPLGAFLAGISTGALATPCAGPVVAALVAHSSLEHSVWYSFAVLLVYGLGLGGLFVIVGTFSGHFTALLPRGHVTVWVKRALGVLLLLPALYYGWALFTTHTDAIPLAATLATAEQAQRPVLLEFTSKTCLPCLQLERTTLQDPRVRAAFADRIVPLRVDATFTTPELEKTIARYNVVGWPTLLFLRPDGTALDELTSVGTVITPEALLERIDRAAALVKAPQP